jgi:hypothetical protein
MKKGLPTTEGSLRATPTITTIMVTIVSGSSPAHQQPMLFPVPVPFNSPATLHAQPKPPLAPLSAYFPTVYSKVRMTAGDGRC